MAESGNCLKIFLFIWLIASPAFADPNARLIRFYHRHYPKIQSEYLEEVSESTKKWARRVCLETELDTLLSIAHRESNFDMTATGNEYESSSGIFQVQEQYNDRLREFWFLNGYFLGRDDDVDTQCAFGVATFYIKLRNAHGSIYKAVRSYNGAGRAARQYAQNVFTSRKVIFKRAYVKGEKFLPVCKKIKANKFIL